MALLLPLLVIEAPGKCRSIASSLGLPVSTVVATQGHFWSQPLRPTGIDRAWHEPWRQPDVKVSMQLAAAAARSGEIVLATDDDQEGDVIARDVHRTLGDQVCEQHVITRMRLRGMDKASVLTAFKLRRRYEPKAFEAGDVRRLVDRMVGGLLHDDERPGAVGRVRTAMLGHLRQRPAKAIYGAITIPVTGERGRAFQASGLFEFDTWRSIHSAVSKVSSLKAGVVVPVVNTPVNTMDVLLAAPEFDLTPSTAMSLMQRMYEDGLLSYPRTRSRALDKAAATWAIEAADRARMPVCQHNVMASLASPSDTGHPCIHPTIDPERIALRAPLLGGNLDQSVLRFIARRTALSVTGATRLEPDLNALPNELRGLGLAEKVHEFGVKSAPGSAQITQRTLCGEMMALTVLADAGIGRPSTYASHASKFSSLGLLQSDGSLNDRGKHLANVDRPGLLSSAFCRSIDQLDDLPAGVDSATVGEIIQSLLSFLTGEERDLLSQRLSASSAEAGIDGPMAITWPATAG